MTLITAKEASKRTFGEKINPDAPEVVDEILNRLSHDEFFIKDITARFEPIIDKAIKKASDKKHVRCEVLFELNQNYDIDPNDNTVAVFGRDAEIINKYVRPLVSPYKRYKVGILWKYKKFPFKKGIGNTDLIEGIKCILHNNLIKDLTNKGYKCFREPTTLFYAIYWGTDADNNKQQ